jgi:hypothetical protein
VILLVCGGRDFDDYPMVCAYLGQIPNADLVIQGGARGADALAKRWARENGIHCAQIDAMWEAGRRGGPARNHAMLLLKPDAVVAFPGGRGTDHMKSIARAAGIPVWEVES